MAVVVAVVLIEAVVAETAAQHSVGSLPNVVVSADPTLQPLTVIHLTRERSSIEHRSFAVALTER